MTYLSIESKVSLADSLNVFQATSLQKQDFIVSPPITVQSGMMWEEAISPGVKSTVANLSRALVNDGTTQFAISQERAIESTVWRLKHVGGTSPVFRTKRSIGIDATSSVRVQVLSTMIARIDTDAGTAINTASVATGDVLLFERTTDSFTSPFAESNQGISVVVAGKGSGFIDVIHNGVFTPESVVLGASFDNAMRVFSSGPLMIGDILELGAGFNLGNQKKVVVALVRDDYVEFQSLDMVLETVTGATIKAYDKFVRHVSVKASGGVILYIDSLPVKVAAIDASGAYACLGVEATKIEIENTNSTSVSAQVLFSVITGGC